MQELSRRTGGAFDVTVGPYVQLWRRARRGSGFPMEQELREAQQQVGYEKMVLNEANRMVQPLVSGMRLDLGGIAKGYALDCALKVLEEHGIRHALLEAGGYLVVGGYRAVCGIQGQAILAYCRPAHRLGSDHPLKVDRVAACISRRVPVFANSSKTSGQSY